MKIAVTSQALAAMRAAADAAHPLEACGILLGTRGQITEARLSRNIHPTPATHFEIEPEALIGAYRAARSGGPAVIGYFHSHPVGEPVPSVTDRACAAGDGKVWAIVSAGDVRFWMDGEQGFVALPFGVSDG